MRKLYALLAGLCMGLGMTSLQAQNPTPDVANFSFTIDPSNQHVSFNNTSVLGSAAGARRAHWSFGDGTGQWTGALQGTQHQYNAPGTYTVCLRIYRHVSNTADSILTAQICKTIVIESTCRADFERLPITVTVDPLMASFKALPWHAQNKRPVRICWKFGDGRDTCIQYSNTNPGPYIVHHRYAGPGNYEVCVIIHYSDGCTARKCKAVQIGRPDECKADFERIPVLANTPQLVGFRALPEHNNDKKPATICWTFGDGRDTCINYPANYTGQYTVAHRYREPGTYEVCVKIAYYGGCIARKCKAVTIPPVDSTVCSVRLFEIAPSLTSLVRGFFAFPHSEPYRRPERICWYFGDGTDTCIMIDPTSTTPLPSYFIRHTYPGPGVYRACVKILFRGGCIATDCEEVVIRPNSNVCGGFMVDSMTAPRTFAFKGFAIHNRNDEVIAYRWNFGDGSGAIGREVRHTYAQGGTYEVCLTIKTRLGCETRICKTVRVPGNNQPALQLSPNPVINTLHVSFFSTHTEQVHIRILSASGLPVREYSRWVTAGPNNWNFELGNLVPGIYTFSVRSPNQFASAVFIKQ